MGASQRFSAAEPTRQSRHWGTVLTSHRELITLEPIAIEWLAISRVTPLSKGDHGLRSTHVNQRSYNSEGGGGQAETY